LTLRTVFWALEAIIAHHEPMSGSVQRLYLLSEWLASHMRIVRLMHSRH
jgi:hypothetical protein